MEVSTLNKREDVLELILSNMDLAPVIRVGNSLRLTYPPSDILKQRFKVIKESTIL